MRVVKLAAALSIAAICSNQGFASDTAATDSEARARLVDKMQAEAKAFCRKVHNAEGALHPNAITEVSSEEVLNPDLLMDYRGIQCEGVDDAPLKQGGFCGLTSDGMKCKVSRFSYRDGEYVETGHTLEGLE